MTPRALLASAWTLAILIVCWTPDFLIQETRRGPRPFSLPMNFDKLVHSGIFAVFGLFWMRAMTSKGRAWKALVAGLVLAALSELGQMAPIVHRDANLADGMADVLGLALGIAAHALASRAGRKELA